MKGIPLLRRKNYNPELDTFVCIVEALMLMQRGCNVGAFNQCENNNEVLLVFKSWASVHPLIWAINKVTA